MNREQYYLTRKQESKDLIKKTIDIFFEYDGNLVKIGEQLNKSKATISRILNSKLFDEMVSNNEIDKKVALTIKMKLLENKKNGNKQGGETFKENYSVIYNEEHRIIGHAKKQTYFLVYCLIK